MLYTLPELPYDVAALEPHYMAKALELHHDKHHKAYVDGANKAIDGLAEARDSDDFSSLAGLEKALAFNVSGHMLHSLFWPSLSPDGGGDPGGELLEAVKETFGSVERLRAQLSSATTTVMGSGWGALQWEPVAGRLLVTQVYDHQSNIAQGALPIMAIDAWEHAFYLQHQTDKAGWVESFWKMVSWPEIERRFVEATQYRSPVAA